jgi:hypothetical protein
MSTDKELLELAARAAGLEHMKWIGPIGLVKMINPSRPDKTGSIGPYWNPLTDDGDALRLAVRLRLRVDCYDDLVEVMDGCEPYKIGPESFTNRFVKIEEFDSDPLSATRRAIVLAAAEIGKAMP